MSISSILFHQNLKLITIISWLHHTNVDRQIAMWQAIYPDSWITPQASGSGTWTITPGTVLDQNSPLTPFYTGDRTTPWTSLGARYTKAFGYSYPEVQDWLPRTPAQLSANVTARVNQLYNPNGILTRRSSSMRTKRATEKVWTVEVNVPNAAVGEGFTVDLSVGEIAIGKLVVVSAPTQAELDAGAKKTTFGEYSLTPGLGGVAEDDIAEFLKTNLKWGVSKNVSDLKGVRISEYMLTYYNRLMVLLCLWQMSRDSMSRWWMRLSRLLRISRLSRCLERRPHIQISLLR